MILHPQPPGLVAFLQSAHALLAFQVADHWGNRTTPRPAPRPDVLAAVLLHDAGWDGREEPPRLATDGSPLAFDSVTEQEQVSLWTGAVERAAVRGRYVAYLVSHHVCSLARRHPGTLHRELLEAEGARQRRLRADLERDPRYLQAFATAADGINRAIVRLADAIAVHLARGARGLLHLPELPQRGGLVELEMEAVAERTYRLRPWPLVGRRLVLHAEGKLLPAARFADEASLQRAWDAAATVRLCWRLLAPGAPAD